MRLVVTERKGWIEVTVSLGIGRACGHLLRPAARAADPGTPSYGVIVVVRDDDTVRLEFVRDRR
jgi:hypothetical protein